MSGQKIKSCLLSLKDIDPKKGIVQFYAASFGGEKDSDGDIIVKGAFKKTLSENKKRLKHLYNHSKTIGVVQDINEDVKGLLVTSKLMQNDDGEMTTAAKDAMIEYEAGGITEHSHGYKVIQESFDKEKQINYITESKLWEVSSLDKWGANEFTPTVGIKSLRTKDLNGNINCTNCEDCRNCIDCTDCKGCDTCIGCSGCRGCYGCVECEGCDNCQRCNSCSDCANEYYMDMSDDADDDTMSMSANDIDLRLKSISTLIRKNISDDKAKEFEAETKKLNAILKSLKNKEAGNTSENLQPIDYKFLTNNY